MARKVKPKAKAKPAKLSARAKARRNAARAREREAEAESLRLSEQAYQRKRKREERESQRLSEIERKRVEAAQQIAKRADKGELSQLLKAYDRMAGNAMTVRIENAPAGEGLLPWLTLGSFEPKDPEAEPFTYSDLYLIFSHWEDDDILSAMIHPQRLAWIRWSYQKHDTDDDPIGKPQGYAPSGAGSWDTIVSEAVQAVDASNVYDDEDEARHGSGPSLASTSTILKIEVYFGKVNGLRMIDRKKHKSHRR